jgi:hypothetical protein
MGSGADEWPNGVSSHEIRTRTVGISDAGLRGHTLVHDCFACSCGQHKWSLPFVSASNNGVKIVTSLSDHAFLENGNVEMDAIVPRVKRQFSSIFGVIRRTEEETRWLIAQSNE